MSRSSIDIQFKELKDMIRQLNNTIESMNSMLSEKDARIAELTEELRVLRKRMFGDSKERTKPLDNPDQLSIMDLLGVESAPEPEREAELIDVEYI